MTTGYSDCACRDCFDISFDGELCHECEEAGCLHQDDHDGAAGHSHYLECQREDAYGMDEEMTRGEGL